MRIGRTVVRVGLGTLKAGYVFESPGKNFSNTAMVSQATHLKCSEDTEKESYCATQSFNANEIRLFWIKCP